MATDESRGMSLKTVAVLVLSLVTYLLWGGAAAIYQAQLDREAAVLAAEIAKANGTAEELDENFRIRTRHGSRVVGVAVVIVAGVCTFVSTSLVHLGSLPDLVPFMLTERLGYLAFCVCVLAATGLGLLWMGKMQQALESGNPFSKGRARKKLPKIRTPKPVDD